jgi:hypothetical protein
MTLTEKTPSKDGTDRSFRGRQNAKFQYAVLAAAGVHGGTEPDLLDEAASWQADDFWQYATDAARPG